MGIVSESIHPHNAREIMPTSINGVHCCVGEVMSMLLVSALVVGALVVVGAMLVLGALVVVGAMLVVATTVVAAGRANTLRHHARHSSFACMSWACRIKCLTSVLPI